MYTYLLSACSSLHTGFLLLFLGVQSRADMMRVGEIGSKMIRGHGSEMVRQSRRTNGHAHLFPSYSCGPESDITSSRNHDSTSHSYLWVFDVCCQSLWVREGLKMLRHPINEFTFYETLLDFVSLVVVICSSPGYFVRCWAADFAGLLICLNASPKSYSLRGLMDNFGSPASLAAAYVDPRFCETSRQLNIASFSSTKELSSRQRRDVLDFLNNFGKHFLWF